MCGGAAGQRGVKQRKWLKLKSWRCWQPGACCSTAPMNSDTPAHGPGGNSSSPESEGREGRRAGAAGPRGGTSPLPEGQAEAGFAQGRPLSYWTGGTVGSAGEGPLCRGETEREQGSRGAQGCPCCGSSLRLGWRPLWESIFADPPRQAGERPSPWRVAASLTNTPRLPL